MTLAITRQSTLLKSIKKKIKKTISAIKIWLMQTGARNGFLASLYYTFASSEFRREQLSVLNARLAYLNNIKNPTESSALLRRNIHRLEKGLIMTPRRSIFAENYIGETVECFAKYVKNISIQTDERKWAGDVLAYYFSVVTSSPKIDEARHAFSKLQIETSGKKSIPYQHHELPHRQVEYSELLNLFNRRRSVRWYAEHPIDSILVHQAVQAASLAPSACNRQPYRFHFLNGNIDAPRVAKLAGGTAGFAENLQGLIVVVGDLSAYPYERDRHVIYIDASLASMQLMLALETLGLATCAINWPDVQEREARISAELDLAIHERVIMLIAVGYPREDGGIPYSQKKISQTLLKTDH